MAATSAATAITGFVGQNAANKANTTAANLAYAQSENQIGERATQVNQQQSENDVQAVIDRAGAGGRINAEAAAGGADAATTTRGEDAASSAAGRALSIEDINSQNQRQGLVNDQAQAFYRRQSQENQVLPGSPVTLALGLVKAGLGGASAYGQSGGLFGGFDDYGSTASGSISQGTQAFSDQLQGVQSGGSGGDLSGGASAVGSGI